MDNGMNNTRKAHEFVDALARLSEQSGVSYDFTDNQRLKDAGHTVEGAVVNGYVTKSGITINLNSKKALNSVVGHEVTHLLEGDLQQFDALKQAMKKFVETKGSGTWDKLLTQTTETYKNVEGVNAENELVADLVGDYLFTDKAFVESLTQEDPGLAKRIYQKIKSLCEIFTGTRQSKQLEQVKQTFRDAFRATKNPAQQDGVRYSVSRQYDYSKSFAEQIKDFQNGQFTSDDTLMVGATPDVLKQIGLLSLPMTINQKHIRDALNGTYKGTTQEKLDHTFTPQELATLPEKLADPVAVIYDKRTGKANASESNIDVLVEMTVASGKQVLAAVQVNGSSRINGIRVDTNKIATVHGNTDSMTRLVDAINEQQNGNVAIFYINNDKTTKALQRTGNPIPSGLSNLDGFIHSITDPGSPVKMRISSVTESQQFKRWFGDWQNHPENASKIVNSDGTPKVVYHGSTEEFTTFSYGHVGSATGVGILGDGFYFTDKKKLAKNYGKNVLPVYLQMKNPYIATESDAYKLRVEDMRQQGFDGVILRAPQGDVYMVFENTQIKSATDNIGTFDGNNPDIRYSVSSEGETMVQDGWRVSGEDVALEQENAADDKHPRNDGVETARNDADEFSAPTEEDIAQREEEYQKSIERRKGSKLGESYALCTAG